MSEKTHKEYSHEELTVVWKPEVCIHAGNCARGLSNVFRPKERPWINMDGADNSNIIAQVKNCPSGALSYYLNGEIPTETKENNSTKIEIVADGPILVHGKLEVQLPNGSQETKTKTTAFCRCGASANKPYCDGAHRKTNFKG